MEEISINRIIDITLVNIKKIVVVAIIGICIGLIYSFCFVDKEYRAKSIVVLQKKDLIDEYSEKIKNSNFLEDISTEFGVSTSELISKIQIDLRDKKINNLGIIYTGKDPEKICNITNRIADKFVSQMKENYNINNVKIGNRATIPTSYYNFSKKIVIKNCIKVSVTLTFIYLVIIFSIEFFSTKIKTVEFIEKDLKLKVLSTISLINKKKDKKYYDLQNDNLVNRFITCLPKNDGKLVILFTNSDEIKENFIDVLKSFSKIKQKIALINLDRCNEISNIPNIAVKNNINDIDSICDIKNKYDIILINANKIDGISLDEKIINIIDNIVIFAKRSATKIDDLEKLSKILTNYNKMDNSYCVMVGEEYLKEYNKYNIYKKL